MLVPKQKPAWAAKPPPSETIARRSSRKRSICKLLRSGRRVSFSASSSEETCCEGIVWKDLSCRARKWSGRMDLIHRPPGHEQGALARLSHAPTGTLRHFRQCQAESTD